jgi:hypothetical protein
MLYKVAAHDGFLFIYALEGITFQDMSYKGKGDGS